MSPASPFVYAMLVLIAEGNGWRMLMAAPKKVARTGELETLEVGGSGGGVGGCVPRSKGLLRACGPDCLGRGPLSGVVEPCPATEVQPGSGG